MKHKARLTEEYKAFDFMKSDKCKLADPDDVMEVLVSLDYGGIKLEKDLECILPTVYTFYDAERHPLYTGKSIAFNNRYRFHAQHFQEWGSVKYIGFILCDDPVTMDLLEIVAINEKFPKYNSDCSWTDSKFKSYTVYPATEGYRAEITIESNAMEYVIDIDDIRKYDEEMEELEIARDAEKAGMAVQEYKAELAKYKS